METGFRVAGKPVCLGRLDDLLRDQNVHTDFSVHPNFFKIRHRPSHARPPYVNLLRLHYNTEHRLSMWQDEAAVTIIYFHRKVKTNVAT